MQVLNVTQTLNNEKVILPESEITLFIELLENIRDAQFMIGDRMRYLVVFPTHVGVYLIDKYLREIQ